MHFRSKTAIQIILAVQNPDRKPVGIFSSLSYSYRPGCVMMILPQGSRISIPNKVSEFPETLDMTMMLDEGT